MPDRFAESHIQRNPLFSRLPPQYLDQVVQAFQVLRFQPGDMVVKQDNPTQGLFIVVSGAATLWRTDSQGQQRKVEDLRADAVVDGGALFHEGRESASLRINEPTTLLFLSRKRMQGLLSHYPEIRDYLGPADTGQRAPRKRPIRPQRRDAKGTFRDLKRDDETMILIKRRHPWSWIRRSWSSILVFSLLIIAAIFVNSTLLTVTLVGLALILGTLMELYFYMEWRNDSIIVTDQRVIRVEKVIPTFSVNINEIPLDSVHEVNTELPPGDLFARIFNYGNVELKNAADAGDLILDTIPNPEKVQNAIFAEREHYRSEDSDQHRRAIRAEIERNLGLEQTAPVQGSEVALTAQGHVPAGMPSKMDDSSPHIWQSLSPVQMRFTNSNGDTVYRKHVTIWLGGIFAPSLVIFAGFIILVFSVFGDASVWLSRFGVPLAFFMWIFGAIWFYWSDWDWRNDTYVLSDETITLIHKRPLWLQNEVDQVLLSRVDNVVSETNGLLNSIFSRGDVRVSLVGEGIDNAKVFQHVYEPHRVQAEISRRQARAKSQNARREEARQREAINEYLSVYHEAVSDAQANEPPPQPPANPPVRPQAAQDRRRPPRIPRVRDDANQT